MLDELLAQLRKSDIFEQMRAAEALGELGDARAIEPLIRALGSGYEWVATDAAIALGKLRAGEAVPALLKTPRAWRDWFDEDMSKGIGDGPHAAYAAAGVGLELAALSAACFRALGQIGDARAVPLLIAALDDPHITNDSEAAAEALSMIGTEEARAALARRRK